MGLGLYITREIVELRGGHIDVEFPPDSATRLVVTVPTGLAGSDVVGAAGADAA
jgi:signal transduction histidine kinase